MKNLVQTFRRYRYSVLAFIRVMCVIGGFLFSGQAMAQVRQFDISDASYAETDLVMGKDAEGYIVMVWTDFRDAWYFHDDHRNKDEGAVYGQIYDPGLNPVGPNFRISQPLRDGTTGIHNLALLVLNDGRFVVTWQKAERTNGDLFSSIMMKMINRQGEALIVEQTVNDHHELLHRWRPQVSMVPGNRFLITWSDLREGNRYKYGQYYDAETGQTLGGNVRLGPDWLEPVNLRHYQVSQDRYLLIFDHRYFQYYDEADTPLGELVDIVEAYDLGHGRLSAFRPFGADSLMVLHGSQYDDQRWFSFANADGTRRSEPVLINDNSPMQMNTWFDLAISEEDQSFILVWEDRRNSVWARMSLSVADAYAQRYDAQARPVGNNFKVNQEPQEWYQMSPTIMYHGNGHFLAAWRESRQFICPDASGGVNPANYDANYLVGNYITFDSPAPGPVWGWGNYVEHRNNFLQTRCGVGGPYERFQLVGNYPNPFNQATTLVFELDVESAVDIEIQVYDIAGREVKVIRPGLRGTGRHEVSLNISGLATGVYIARMTSRGQPGLHAAMKLLKVK